MPRRRSLRRFPSYRNLWAYHEVAYHRRSQAAVAAERGISQVRVSQICRQTQAWVDCLVPPRHYLGQPGLRLHLAIAHERVRLKEDYGPLLELFLGDAGEPRYLKRSVTVVGGEALQTVEVTEVPDYRLLNQAVDIQARLAELEAIANLGPFADVPGQIRQTTVHRYCDDGVKSADSAAPKASKLTSNAHVRPFNPAENRSRGVLNECPQEPSPRAQLPSSAEFAAAAGSGPASEFARTKSC
jgi:hypothetical protein